MAADAATSVALDKFRPLRDNTAIFVCDLQTRFRPAIHSFDDVVNTTRKVLKIAKVLQLPVLFTEQNPTVLGGTVEDIDKAELEEANLYLGTFSKHLFSMITTKVQDVLTSRPDIKHIVILGIEAHICVLQTALDLLARNYNVHVAADGVSSCNPEEVRFALDTVRQAGAQVTTTETLMYQLIVDATDEKFRIISKIVKEDKQNTKRALQNLTRKNA